MRASAASSTMSSWWAPVPPEQDGGDVGGNRAKPVGIVPRRRPRAPSTVPTTDFDDDDSVVMSILLEAIRDRGVPDSPVGGWRGTARVPCFRVTRCPRSCCCCTKPCRLCPRGVARRDAGDHRPLRGTEHKGCTTRDASSTATNSPTRVGKSIRRERRRSSWSTAPMPRRAKSISEYYVVSAASHDEAVEIAKTCPHVEGKGRVEVRAIENLE